MAEHQDRMSDAFQAVLKIKAGTAKESADNVKRAKDKCTGPCGAILNDKSICEGVLRDMGRPSSRCWLRSSESANRH